MNPIDAKATCRHCAGVILHSPYADDWWHYPSGRRDCVNFAIGIAHRAAPNPEIRTNPYDGVPWTAVPADRITYARVPVSQW